MKKKRDTTSRKFLYLLILGLLVVIGILTIVAYSLSPETTVSIPSLTGFEYPMDIGSGGFPGESDTVSPVKS